MRIWLTVRKRIPWLIAAAVVILLIYKYRQRSDQYQSALPTLKKSYIRKGTNVLIGPFTSGKGTVPAHGVTFVTHTSLQNLYRLQILELVWKSPISVAVWASGDITRLVELCYMLTLACDKFQQLTVSILLPADKPYQVDVASIDWNTILHPSTSACSQKNVHNRLYALRALETNQNYDSSVPYPNNKLRNIALSQAHTPYVIVADMDLVPSLDMENQLMTHLHSNPVAERMALVVPVFESQNAKLNQWSMDRLLSEWTAGHVRPFYVETCPQCQGPTQYTNWIERQSSESKPTNPTLLLYKPGWEPFVVLNRTTHPSYDERFVQFGYNRMSLICELHMSGYSFYALDRVFLVHDGFKTEDGFHTEKDAELVRNELLYAKFREELARRLNTRRTC